MKAGTPTRRALQIAAIYCFVAALWILFSDQAVGLYFSDPKAMTHVAMIKGWAFVAVTAALLFVLIRRQLNIVGTIDRAQHRAEEAVRDSEARYKRLVSSISDILFSADLKGTITFIGPQVSHFGYTQEEIIGQNLLSLVYPEDRERVAGEFQKAIVSGVMASSEFRVLTKNSCVAWLQENSGFILDEAGRHVGVSGMLRNTTEKKLAEAERQSMQEQLNHAQKMEAIGQLAGGVAHDFNNILTVFAMNLETLREEADHLPPDLRPLCNELQEATNRATALTRQLLLFARRQIVQKRNVDVDALLGNLLNMLRRLIGENIKVEFHCAPRQTWVIADPGMLEQLVMNLVVNARDAMPSGGRLRIETSLHTFVTPSATEATTKLRRSGNFVCIAVCDSGCGMSEETQQHIFEPFFTTKEAGKGTGLGLATVFGIVQQHEGWIELESAPSNGSTFQIFLPEANPVVLESSLPAPSAKGGTESILIAEDEPGVRQLCANTLQRMGYQVATAANGIEAIALWKEHHGSFDLLLTDMIMPETLSGLELAQTLRRSAPTLKVLIMSGYSLELSQQGILEENKMSFLPKPFDPLTLTRTVRDTLNSTR